MPQCRTALLVDRGLVEVAGSDATDFLQGLVTNDVDHEQEGEALFAGLLTPQGKILCDFFVIRREAKVYWLECARAQAGDLVKRLTMYKLRAKITVADRTDEFAIAASWGAEGASGVSAIPALAASVVSYADPRFAPLGWRHILPATDAASFSENAGAAAADEAAYHAHRIGLFVPQGGVDYIYGESFPHESGYDSLNGVDFEKGCYVGQEVVSRMHHRGTAKTRIAGVELVAPLAAHAEADVDTDASALEIRAADLPVGVLCSRDGTHAIATVRVDRAEEALQQGIPLQTGDVALTLRQPAWAQYRVPVSAE
ncbi:MAG: folate-binding protein [Alphaproteobacteria bacterium]